MGEELRTTRKEIKYIVPLEKALMIKDRLELSMERDSYCVNNAYAVRSLYFDSVNNIDFSQKLGGIDIRKKIRLRIYDGSASLCKLEVKQKECDRQCKQSFIIGKEDAKELMKGNYSVLKNYFIDSAASIKAYAIMVRGQYRPVVLVEYDRLAYKYAMYNTRITLDMGIRSTESNLNIFSENIFFTPIMYEKAVLEVKYSGKVMGFISNILSQFELTQASYSKYCSGRKTYYDFNY